MSRWQLVVVPHTHWDREWYRSHEAFRYRLVRMLDGLLDLLERDPSYLHFTLDGQTIAVDGGISTTRYLDPAAAMAERK